MAHFAGTGPANKCCKQCRHWGTNTNKTLRGKECLVYMRMMSDPVKRLVPGHAMACKFFEAKT